MGTECGFQAANVASDAANVETTMDRIRCRRNGRHFSYFAESSTPPVNRDLAGAATGGSQYGSMIVACMVYPASPTPLRNACVLIMPVTHTGSNSSFIG